MSWQQLAIIAVAFVVLYKFIIPFLFPTVVQARKGTLDVNRVTSKGQGGSAEQERILTQGVSAAGSMPFLGDDRRSHDRALRRRHVQAISSADQS